MITKAIVKPPNLYLYEAGCKRVIFPKAHLGYDHRGEPTRKVLPENRIGVPAWLHNGILATVIAESLFFLTSNRI